MPFIIFFRDTDIEILGDLEETTNLLHQHSQLFPMSAKKKTIYRLYHFGRQVSTTNPEDVTRILAPTIEGGRFYELDTASSLQQMYAVHSAEKQHTTKVHFPGLDYDERSQRELPNRRRARKSKKKLPHLPGQQEQMEQPKSPPVEEYPIEPTAHLWKSRLSSSENSEWDGDAICDYTRLSAYRYGRTPHVGSHDYPLTKQEVTAVEQFLETICRKTSTVKWVRGSKIEAINKRSTIKKKSSSLDQEIMNSLFADPEAMHVLRRNPAAVLEQLRRRLKPGELTHVLDEVMRETGGKKSKKIFLHALQKAVHAEKDAKQQLLKSPIG